MRAVEQKSRSLLCRGRKRRLGSNGARLATARNLENKVCSHMTAAVNGEICAARWRPPAPRTRAAAPSLQAMASSAACAELALLGAARAQPPGAASAAVPVAVPCPLTRADMARALGTGFVQTRMSCFEIRLVPVMIRSRRGWTRQPINAGPEMRGNNVACIVYAAPYTPVALKISKFGQRCCHTAALTLPDDVMQSALRIEFALRRRVPARSRPTCISSRPTRIASRCSPERELPFGHL